MTVIKTRTLALIGLVAIFGGISLSSLLGWWKTTSTKEPARIKSGEFAGLPSPTDIRGSYTWLDIEKAFGVPASRLVEAFGSAGPGEKVNTLEGLYAGELPEGVEIGTDSVRYFVSLYTGLPFSAEGGDTVLPATAVPILRSEGKADPALIDAAAARAWKPAGPAGTTTAPASASPSASVAPASPAKSAAVPAAATSSLSATVPPEGGTKAGSGTGEGAAPGTIVGKTTFYDLKSWGYDMAKVEQALGGIGQSAQTIKDWCTGAGLEFSVAKTRLAEIAPR